MSLMFAASICMINDVEESEHKQKNTTLGLPKVLQQLTPIEMSDSVLHMSIEYIFKVSQRTMQSDIIGYQSIHVDTFQYTNQNKCAF